MYHAAWQDWSGPEIGLRILLARRQILDNWNFDDLAAPHWRLYHCRGEGAEIIHEGIHRRLDAGHFWLIPPELAFSAKSRGSICQLYVHFLLMARLRNSASGILAVPVASGLDPDSILAAPSDSDWANACLVQQLVLGALAAVPGETFIPEPSDPRATRLIRLMRGEPGKNWSNAELAQAAGFHPQALVRWFRQHTGTTPRKFLLDLRLREASLQLLYTSRGIDEIAARLGFFDRYHFSSAFAKFRGVPPATYRKQRDHWPARRLENDLPWN